MQKIEVEYPFAAVGGDQTDHTRRCALRPPAAMAKRCFDIAGSLFGLLLTAPLLAGCVLWIRMQDGGPAVYRQWRVGRDGWLFQIYKLRTMRHDAEHNGARFAQADDPRVLPGCGWMRRSHVDELPQLWNVLRGQMSLVGPRPERPEMIEQLRPMIRHIDRRHVRRPGLTGLAQVVNGYTNDVAGARRKMAYDMRYLRRYGLLGELGIVLRTLPRMWDPLAM